MDRNGYGNTGSTLTFEEDERNNVTAMDMLDFRGHTFPCIFIPLVSEMQSSCTPVSPDVLSARTARSEHREGVQDVPSTILLLCG